MMMIIIITMRRYFFLKYSEIIIADANMLWRVDQLNLHI